MPPASIPKRPLTTTLTILGLWLIFYGSFTLITPALLDDADSVHAEVAREMLLRHDWITLYANGIRYLEKAPLLYWAMALCMGISQLAHHASAAALAIAARVPLALTVLALACTIETFTRRAFSKVEHGRTSDALNCRSPEQVQIGTRAGFYAALILLSSFGLFLFTRITIPDAMLTLYLTLAIFFFWLTESPGILVTQNFRLPAYAFAACCALAVLTKGLIGLLFPIAIVITYLILTRGPRAALQRFRLLHPFSSVAVFLAIAVPWHILIALANPTQGHPAHLAYTVHPAAGAGHWQVPLPTDGNVHGWAWFYFINEQLLRYLNLRVPRDYDTVPLVVFLGLILIWLMPWSIFLFRAVAHSSRSAFAQIALSSKLKAAQLKAQEPFFFSMLQSPQPCPDGRVPQLQIHALLLLWAAIPLLFFSFSTRQEYYVLPSLPPLAILIAVWLASDTTPKTYRANLRATAVLLSLGTLFATATTWFLLHTHTPAANTDLSTLLQQNPTDYAMSMGHFLDLNPNALALFRLPLVLAAISLFLGPLASYLLRRRAYVENSPKYSHAATLALAAGAFTFLLAAHLGLRTFAPILTSQQLAAALRLQIQPGDLLVIHQEYEYASTLGFYLQQPIYRFEAVRISPQQTTPPGDHDHAIVDIRAIAVNPIHILTDPTYNGTPNYGRSSNLWYGSFFPDAPPIFETAQSLTAKWRAPRRIFLWQDSANQPSPLSTNLTPIYVIATSGGKQIVSNQSNHL